MKIITAALLLFISISVFGQAPSPIYYSKPPDLLRDAGLFYLTSDLLVIGGSITYLALSNHYSKFDTEKAEQAQGTLNSVTIGVGIAAVILRFSGHLYLHHAGKKWKKELSLTPTENGIGLTYNF